jgi:PAS domain-containing protein
MSQDVLTTETSRRQLQQIITGLSDGVILLDLDQTIVWANDAALAMHGIERIGELGATPGNTHAALPCVIATITRCRWPVTRSAVSPVARPSAMCWSS